MRNIFLLLFVGLLLSACGGGGGGSSKSLFSIWESDDDILDLRNATLNAAGTYQFTVIPTLENCLCDSLLAGTETSGTAILSNCTYTSGGSGDPGCAGLNGTYSYEVSGSSLEVCDSVPTCTTYR